jgi:hypothetical protein
MALHHAWRAIMAKHPHAVYNTSDWKFVEDPVKNSLFLYNAASPACNREKS